MKRNIIIAGMLICVIIAGLFNYNQRQERKEVYRQIAYNILSEIDTMELMMGINFNRAVNLHEVKMGDTLIQYQYPNSPQGNFYAYEDSKPLNLGISGEGKEKRYYCAKKDLVMLSSFAAPIEDNWSIPGKKIKTYGQDLQLFSTCKDCFERIK